MKKISLLILMLTFLLIPTCVNANGVSWEDFIDRMNEVLSKNQFEEDLNSSSLKTNFLNDYNNCYSFYVLGNYGFAHNSLDSVEADKLFFIFSTRASNTTIDVKTSTSSGGYYYIDAGWYKNVYTYNIEEHTFSRKVITASSDNIIYYYLNEQTSFSAKQFFSETGLNYILSTIYDMGWNGKAWCNYYTDYPDGLTDIGIEFNSISDSDWPWEDGNAGGSSSGDTYYNYDFNEYFQKPWISIDNVQGLVQNTATIPFKVMSQSGDEYYPFNKLKLDLRVYKVFTDENGNKTQSLFDTYKRYNGDYVDTTGYNSVTQNGNINIYNYDLRSKFDSNFIDTYLNTSGDNFDYAFQLVLYSFWEDELSSTKLFYFNQNNNLNSGTIPDNYYDNNWNSGGDFNFENMNFDSVLNTAKNFLSSILGFFSLFPDWLIYLLTFGISVGIILRILGR